MGMMSAYFGGLGGELSETVFTETYTMCLAPSKCSVRGSSAGHSLPHQASVSVGGCSSFCTANAYQKSAVPGLTFC